MLTLHRLKKCICLHIYAYVSYMLMSKSVKLRCNLSGNCLCDRVFLMDPFWRFVQCTVQKILSHLVTLDEPGRHVVVLLNVFCGKTKFLFLS